MTSTAIYIENIHKSCVYLITYSGDKLPPKFKNSSVCPNKYIGSGTVENVFDGYRGSVASKKYGKIWKQELKDNPQFFHLDFISLHDNRQDAYDEEERIQRKLDVVKCEEYVNLTIANGNFYNIGHSKDTIEKISKSRKGQPAHNKGKPSPIKGLPKGPQTPTHIEKLAKTRRGRISPLRGTRKSDFTKMKGSLNNSQNKPVIIEGILYRNIVDAMQRLNLSRFMVKKLGNIA
jgi:hypothetical protein